MVNIWQSKKWKITIIVYLMRKSASQIEHLLWASYSLPKNLFLYFIWQVKTWRPLKWARNFLGPGHFSLTKTQKKKVSINVTISNHSHSTLVFNTKFATNLSQKKVHTRTRLRFHIRPFREVAKWYSESRRQTRAPAPQIQGDRDGSQEALNKTLKMVYSLKTGMDKGRGKNAIAEWITSGRSSLSRSAARESSIMASTVRSLECSSQ